ncbi:MULTISPECIES: hypothetical protein [unclassified Kitasatospora]|uniref:hypothetical protein n=1 Tax=unclassified Kitasatospora TaxID=2633591 RepID=UPI00070AC293|nr:MULTISPECIES: hypothetical protein [unclassified Kitasatospora]KQV21800.1 hypothetical protein ASC99_19150 [Kitasatospora sp. Root107]KRB75408.1 hypothetical protein ASE03_15605 [Kitasatospora sp. Root187]
MQISACTVRDRTPGDVVQSPGSSESGTRKISTGIRANPITPSRSPPPPRAAPGGIDASWTVPATTRATPTNGSSSQIAT